jgi:hypothetical protein
MEHLRCAIRPTDPNISHGARATQAKVQSKVALRKVTAAAKNFTQLRDGT